MIELPPHSHDVEIQLSNGITVKAPVEVWVAALVAALPKEVALKAVEQAALLIRNTMLSLGGNGMKVSTTENIWKKLAGK